MGVFALVSLHLTKKILMRRSTSKKIKIEKKKIRKWHRENNTALKPPLCKRTLVLVLRKGVKHITLSARARRRGDDRVNPRI